MSQIGHLIVTPDVAIQRPSDQLWFRFETYQLRAAEWGFNLRQADGKAASNISDPDWHSESQVIGWLHDNIESWDRVEGLGWCSDSRDAPTGMAM
jgi:hypothetical protein